MKKNKKIIFNTVFLLLVFVLTIYGVFHGEDLGDVIEVIENADKRWLLPGIALVAFFICGESVIIWYMMRSYGIHLKKTSCFLFSSVGFFFQLYHTVCERWAANADLLHEERKGFHSGGNGHIDDRYDYI